MADIRQTTAFLDDFDRADQSPLNSNWGPLDTGIWTPCDLDNNTATHEAATTSSMSYWLSQTFDGDDAEAWGQAEGGNANGTAWGIGLFQQPGGSNQADGYRFRLEVGIGSGFTLRKFTNGVSGSALDVLDPGGSSGNPGLLLIRRNGNDVEGWWATQLDGSDFTMVVSATDTTYVNGLYLAIGVTDNSSSQLLGWETFGGGPLVPHLPQFIRRPWRYQGVPLSV